MAKRESPEATRLLLEAIAFAARAHQGQLRKDQRTPYASHVFRVCLIVRQVFGVEDASVLTAAVLHDTIEDTTTDFDDVAKEFGPEIARWVSALSKDKRLPEDQREKAYEDQLAQGPWQVKICKLADIYDNLMDAIHMPPEKQARAKRNAHRYLAALKSNLPEEARGPWDVVAGLLAEIEAKS
ncbi:MAG TPA: HD domain-containing protein [Gemmataceae bacterium]|jgi:guanosine-3',5'-bis(diphosphate) 3'-pyrophosphohydrolase|nr:HD domain-containing protein [Gemmataceae bacterium]